MGDLSTCHILPAPALTPRFSCLILPYFNCLAVSYQPFKAKDPCHGHHGPHQVPCFVFPGYPALPSLHHLCVMSCMILLSEHVRFFSMASGPVRQQTACQLSTGRVKAVQACFKLYAGATSKPTFQKTQLQIWKPAALKPGPGPTCSC